MTTLPVPGTTSPAMYSDADSPANQCAANFGQLVQKIVQSNSGQHHALAPTPRIDREDNWAEYRTMAERATSAGNFAHAEGMWLKAIARSHEFDRHDWRKAYSLDSLSIMYYAQHRYDEAEVLAIKALEASQQSYGEVHLKTAEIETFVASISFILMKPEEALSHAKKALEIYEKTLDEVDAKIATACYNLAIIYHSRGSFDEAETYYQRAFKLRATIYGWDHDMTTRVSKAYGELSVDKKNHREAKEMLDRLIGPVHPAPHQP
ncbi:MAG: tetratricopeptide repeat protein [Candidatus Obscuribacterales bacterium]|nr:tetratricopeptide repeat protein [Candidatus Obscuribacterales bacterium]